MVVTLIIICLISAILAIQVAEESTLILRVKSWLHLSQPYSKSFRTLSKLSAWRRMLGTAFYLLFPLVICFLIILRLHAFLSEMLDCSTCSSFHICWILLYFIVGVPLGYSFLLAPLGILAVYLINRIK